MGMVVNDIAPIVVTLKDGTILHMDRTGRVLRSSGPSRARFLGGPGSGNFGHAGRPGEIGGSAPSGQTVTTSDVRASLEREGFKTVTMETFPKEVVNAWRNSTGIETPIDATHIPSSTVEGVKAGLKDFQNTKAGDIIKNKTQVGFLKYQDDAQATTAMLGAGNSYLIFNLGDQALENANPSLMPNTIPGQIALAQGLSGDSLNREFYRQVAIHEIGHVLDAAELGGLSAQMVSDLMVNHGPYEGMRVVQQISPYAASGPQEAFAEIFTATVAGRQIKGLEDFQTSIRQRYLTKNPRTLGGPGSGNFGHAGRPGEVGGSAPSGGHEPWTSPGGYMHTGVEWKQPIDTDGRPIPIHVRTVEEGVQLVLQGKVVEVDTPEAAYTLIERLGERAELMQAAGRDAQDFDLCQVTVKGTNLFCAESVRTAEYPEGIPRLRMPQLGGEPIPGSEAAKLPRTPWNPKEVDGASTFKSYLASIGMKTTDEVVPAAGLRASQREMKGLTVGGMMRSYDDGSFDPAKNPIFISSDNYVIDGHHRWAAVVGIDARNNRLGDSTMNVVRVNAPVAEVLHIANLWSERFGIKQLAGVVEQSDKVRAKPEGKS